MQKPVLLLLVFCTFAKILCSQSINVVCDKLLATPVPFDEDFTEETFVQIQTSLLNLVNCGLDSIDVFILTNGPLLGTIMVNQMSNPKINVFTYQHILEGLSKFKSVEIYKNLRTQVEESFKLGNQPASINNWEKDKILFEELGVSDSIIIEISNIIKKDTQLTYKQLFKKYLPQNEHMYKNGFFYESVKEVPEIDYYTISKGLNYSEALDRSKNQNKPILLYFTCFGCLNAQKLEHYVLSEKKIISFIDEHFIFLPLYVDDTKEIPQEEWYKSKYQRTTINSVGKKNLEIQISKFENNSQPYLVIINSQEEICGTIGFTHDMKAFEKFLTVGLEKYKASTF